MNNVSHSVADILKEEFTSITVNNLITYCSEQVGKNPDSLETKDIPKFSKKILQSVFLLLGTEKMVRINHQLQELASVSGFELDLGGSELHQ